MKFCLAYKDIAGSTGSLTFEAGDLATALIGLKDRAMAMTEWADEAEFRTAYPLVLVDESMVGHILEEFEEGQFRVQGGEE